MPWPQTNPTWCPRHSPGERQWGCQGWRRRGMGVTLGDYLCPEHGRDIPDCQTPNRSLHAMGAVSQHLHGSMTSSMTGSKARVSSSPGTVHGSGVPGSPAQPGNPPPAVFWGVPIAMPPSPAQFLLSPDALTPPLHEDGEAPAYTKAAWSPPHTRHTSSWGRNWLPAAPSGPSSSPG